MGLVMRNTYCAVRLLTIWGYGKYFLLQIEGSCVFFFLTLKCKIKIVLMEELVKAGEQFHHVETDFLFSQICFHCRRPGHGVADCPAALESQDMGTGICYRCGSTEHEMTKCRASVDPALGGYGTVTWVKRYVFCLQYFKVM